MTKHIPAFLIASCIATLPLAAVAQDPASAVSTDGLQLVEEDKRGELYADPNVDWTVYSRIQLDEATVAFRRNWERDNRLNSINRVSTRDIQRIKQNLATMFDQVWAEELSTNGGFEIVDEAAPDVLRITPHIVDLDVYAPSTNATGSSYNFAESSGRMTLKLELYDSETGDLVALASDKQQSPFRGYMQWTTGPSNKGDARDIMIKWAQALNARLQEATGKAP